MVLGFASGSVVLVVSWAGEAGSVVCGFVCCVCFVLHVCVECVVFCCGSIYVRGGQMAGGVDTKSPAFVSCSDRVVPVFAVVMLVLCMNVLGERLVQVCGGK